MHVNQLEKILDQIGVVERKSKNTRSAVLHTRDRVITVAYAYSKRHPEEAPNRYAYWWTFSSSHYSEADWVLVLCEGLDGAFLFRGADFSGPIQRRPKADRGWDLELYTDGQSMFRFYGPGIIPTSGSSRYVPAPQLKPLLTHIASSDAAWREFKNMPPLFLPKLNEAEKASTSRKADRQALEAVVESREKHVALAVALDNPKEAEPHTSPTSTPGNGNPTSKLPEVLGDQPPPDKETPSPSLNPVTSPPLPAQFDFAFNRITRTIQDCGLVYDNRDLYSYHLKLTCLPNKHFVILSGISGTGKTELARAYANAVYHQDPLRKSSPYFLAVQVEADWQSMRPLLGFFNHLTGQYERKPFLDMLIRASECLRAAADTEAAPPFFACLDEMNISRVEYYFSRLLSAMESGNPIHLHNGEADKDGIPREISYPSNLYLTATINTDESTFAISDKVLDRAYVVELSSVDTEAYKAILKRAPEYVEHGPIIDRVFDFLKPMQEVLLEARFHMGYRTLKEIIAFVVKSQQEPGILTLEEALDDVLAAKGLAKLRGSTNLLKTLDSLASQLARLGDKSICLRRITDMRKEISQHGLGQFAR